MAEKIIGTIAIDLGNTNTVLAFQSEKSSTPILLEMPSIAKSPGIVPSTIWYEENKDGKAMIGTEALKMINQNKQEEYFYSNFKRLIGNPYEEYTEKYLSPEEAGEKFFKRLWDYIPELFIIKRLVLTAPIDTYKGYRRWLVSICNNLPIKEIALVDEPTAAAIGINIPFGSKVMILDIGGSTIDLNIVRIEGGEGKSAPIAELLKFNGKDVSEISKQKLRCAEIISKSACKLGGKDIDRWIVEYFVPSNNSNKDSRNLSIAENLKIHLSEKNLNSDKQYVASFFINNYKKKDFKISKCILEEILISNNLIKLLNSLLKNLLNDARGKDCKISDLYSVILVGGGSQIPLIRNWINYKLPEVNINYPPPIESIALGALSLTPGVKIKDILSKGLLIRLFNKRENKHFWHPIFYKGQTWPTEKPFELVLQPSNTDQVKFEIIIGETIDNNDFEIIFENGIPKLAEIQKVENIKAWNRKPLMLTLNTPTILGQDCLKLVFTINEKSNLCVECKDSSDSNIGVFDLGSIY